jgi:hypothetical protein
VAVTEEGGAMTATDEAPLIGDAEALTVADRCDRCGAQARVRVTLTSMLELLFCGNHYHRAQEAIEPLTLTVRDEREWVLERGAR